MRGRHERRVGCSALGFLRAPISYEVVRSQYARLTSFDAPAVAAVLAAMRVEAAAVVASGLDFLPAAQRPPTAEVARAFMRYLGQGHEIPVEFEAAAVGAPGFAERLRALFEVVYRQQYAREIPAGQIEVLSWGLTVSADVYAAAAGAPTAEAGPAVAAAGAAQQMEPPPPHSMSEVWDVVASRALPVPLFERQALPGGCVVPGPAIIFEDNTSTVVSPSFRCAVAPGSGDLHLSRQGPAAAVASRGVLDGVLAESGVGAGAAAALEVIQNQTMWARLQAVVEEQATVLLRTAMSVIVREGGDLSCGIFDLQGRMMAQAVTGTPGHVNSMAESVLHFMDFFPTMREGDVYTTNDPWQATGHLWDFMIVTPAFHRGVLIGTIACTSHITDVGGIGYTPDGARRPEFLLPPVPRRTSPARPRRDGRAHGGALRADDEDLRRGRAQRDADADHCPQHPAAHRDRGRPLLADELQRGRPRPASGDDGGVRPRLLGGSLGLHLHLLRGRSPRADRQAAPRHLAALDDLRR
jgi:5-oxoprolinase (ATP-hydrolysing)/N-methylhydantoinase A